MALVLGSEDRIHEQDRADINSAVVEEMRKKELEKDLNGDKQGEEVKEEKDNTNEKAMSVIDNPIPADVMESIKEFTNEIKDIPENVAKYMKAIFYSTLITMGAISYAQADTLKVQVSDDKALTVHNVYYDKEYNFPTSMVNQVCDVNGNHNERIDTDKEEDCVYNTEENYVDKYEKIQEKLTKANYVLAGTLQTDTKKNMERAEELRKEIKILENQLAELKEKDRELTEKDRELTEKDRELTEKDRELTEDIRDIEAKIKAKKEIIKSIQLFA